MPHAYGFLAENQGFPVNRIAMGALGGLSQAQIMRQEVLEK
jgi:hypothetical protein